MILGIVGLIGNSAKALTVADNYFLYGRVWAQKGDLDRAIDYYSKAIKADPQYAPAYNNRGMAWADKGDFDNAISDYGNALRLMPNNSVVLFNRGLAWHDKGNLDKAIKDYDQALVINPKFYDAYTNRGIAWYDKRDLDKAIADYNRAIQIDPMSGLAYTNRGVAFDEKGELSRAIDDQNQALKVDPQDVDAYINRGIIWAKRAENERAMSDFNKALSLNPRSDKAYVNRGIVWFNQGEFDKAITDYDLALSLNPKAAIAFNNRGNAWHNKNELDNALADYSRAIRIDPASIYFYINRGLVWFKKGELDRAIEDYTSALGLDPSFTLAYKNRGIVWSLSGSFQEAISDFKKVLEANPGDSDTREHLHLAQTRELNLGIDRTEASQYLTRDFKRVALIIGNDNYAKFGRLKNPVSDAKLLFTSLRAVGFDQVMLELNLNREQMLLKLSEFEQLANGADEALVYFAGHGIEVNGVNYLIPTDINVLEENSISKETVNLNHVLKSVEVASKLRLVIVDACRDNPFTVKPLATRQTRGLSSPSIFKGRGLARVEPLPGTLVVYATKHGEVAFDGEGNHSPFAESLVKRILQVPPIEVRRLFDYVREDVFESTNKSQQPFAYGSLSARDDFYFRK